MVPLADALDLEGFPGGPFTDSVVFAAAESVRSECGWHIAPQVTETITVDSPGGRVLLLPSLFVTEVTAVRDVTGDEPRTLTGWRISRAGMLHLAGGWPEGFAAVEVDLTHGYESCPAELLAVIADRALRNAKDSTVVQESLGSRSVSYRDAPLASPVLARYRLQGAP